MLDTEITTPLPEPPMLPSKPSRTFIAKALPARGAPGKFYAQYSLPNLIPNYVRSSDIGEESDEGGNVPILFDSEDEAEAEAAFTILDILNNRPGMPGATRPHMLRAGSTVVGDDVMTTDGRHLPRGTVLAEDTMILKPIDTRQKKEAYRQLEGAEFSTLLAEAGITPSFWAYLGNTNLDNLIKWIDGVDETRKPPHLVRVILEIFKANARAPLLAGGAIDIAEAVADAVTTSRKPRRDGLE